MALSEPKRTISPPSKRKNIAAPTKSISVLKYSTDAIRGDAVHEQPQALHRAVAAHEPRSEPQHCAAIDIGAVIRETAAPMLHTPVVGKATA